jgi:choline dehydrogenase
VLPYFRRAESNDLGASEFHGIEGPLSVQKARYVHPMTRQFVAAAVESGLPFLEDLNGASQDGVGFNQATQRRGWRMSTARAYLAGARRRPNLKILTRACVTRIVFAGTRAVGVEYRRHQKLQRATAAREVIVAAGAIGSPHLLMLSGVGPARQLQAHGIPVVYDSAGVGENLQEHAGPWMNYHVRVPTLNNEKGRIKQVLHGLNWLLFGRGPATTPGAQAVVFLRSTSREPQPDLQVHFAPVGYKRLPGTVVLHDEPTLSALPNVCRPRSRGRISLRTADHNDAPRIDMALLDNAEDLNLLIEGCRRIRHIMSQSSMARFVVEESAPGSAVRSDREWEEYLRDAVAPCYHPVGTCRMGSDAGSVVDPELRVRGVTGLRVADASIMPLIPSGNTNAAAVMIGEKASDLIRGRQQARI